MQRNLAPNPVRDAVRALGGMTQTIVKTQVSEATWKRWRRIGRIIDTDAVFLVSDLTGIDARLLAKGAPTGNGGSPSPQRRRRPSVAPDAGATPALALVPEHTETTAARNLAA